MHIDKLTELIIGAAIKVHRTLGSGLLESVYQAALEYELKKLDIPYEREKGITVPYEDIFLDVGFRCDFLVDKRVIVECKSVKQLAPIDEAQTINYMKLAKVPAALLINFNEVLLKNGLRRFVNKDMIENK